MNLPDIKDLVRDGREVQFLRYQSGELWYACDGGFEFPVPILDTGDGAFLARDRAILFMRWIRKHLAYLVSAMEASANDRS